MTSDAGAGDLIHADAYSVAELRDAVFRDKGSLSRPLALALLGRKAYPRKVADMSRLLLDEAEQPRLRIMAGQILGQAGTPAAVRALERGLSAKNELALRGAVEGLRQAGRPETPAMLSRLKRRKGVVGKEAARAAAVVSHRFGQRGNELPETGEPTLLRISPRRSQPIEVSRAPAARVQQALDALGAAIRGTKLVADGATRLRCADRDLLLLFEKAMQEEPPEHLAAGKTLAAAVVEKAVLEGTTWSVTYQLLTEPEKDGAIRLVVASMRGVPVYAGSARIKGGRVTFSLRALELPGLAAINIQGAFEKGRLAIKQARSNLRRHPGQMPAKGSQTVVE